MGVVKGERLILGDSNPDLFMRRSHRRKGFLRAALDKGGPAGKREEFFAIARLAELLAKRGQLLGAYCAFSDRDQAQMPLGYQVVREVTQIAQERYAGFCLDCLLQQASVTCSSDAVGEDAYHVDLWIDMLESQHHGGCTSRHRTCIDDQHDRCLEDLCYLGSTSYVACAPLAIIEPHHPLDHGDLSRGSSTTKHVQHTAGWRHPGIQVIAVSGCSKCEMGRIDIVWPNFERVNLDASRASNRNEGGSNDCLGDTHGL